MSHTMTDRELIEELQLRFERSRKAFSDLTVVNLKLREMNQKLEQSERLKSNFLSNIRNEINDPLNALVVLSDQISAHSNQNPELARLATLIHAEAFNLVFQLRNIFMAAELEAGIMDVPCTGHNEPFFSRQNRSHFKPRTVYSSVVLPHDSTHVFLP